MITSPIMPSIRNSSITHQRTRPFDNGVSKNTITIHYAINNTATKFKRGEKIHDQDEKRV